MARASDGTYSRVSNSFSQPVTGTLIRSDHADTFWGELETEMTDSLSRTGKGGMLAHLSPNTDDGFALGTTTKKWSDLHLASGAIINWNAGDVTLTHSTDALAFSGGTVSFSVAPTISGGAVYYAGGTDVAVADGGTGFSSFAIGDLLYASGAAVLSKLADVATGNALLSGGVATAPAWGKITSSHVNSSTGSGAFALQTSPAFVTPSIGAATGTTLALSPAGGLGLQINLNAATPPASPYTDRTTMQIVSAANADTFSLYDAYGISTTHNATPHILLRTARGSVASPSAVGTSLGGTYLAGTGDYYGAILAGGYGATGFPLIMTSGIAFRPTQLQTDTAQGSQTVILTTPNGTALPVYSGIFDQDGSLKVGPNATAMQAALAGTMLQVASANGANTFITIDAFGTSLSPGYLARHARGTIAAPTALQSGDIIGQLNFIGYGATAYGAGVAGVVGNATQNWTDANQGANLTFRSTPDNTASAVIVGTFGQSGGLAVGLGAVDTTAGVINTLTGFRINSAAASGNVLRGNGTNFVSSTLGVSDLSGAGTGVLTALAVNVGSAGAFVTFNGALGSPSSAGTLPAFTLGGTVTSNGQSFSGTIANLGTVTTADINGGTIDGAVIGGAATAAGSFTTIAASGLISANGGQIAFPASQSASADANTLDDYEEGTWTPTITFSTPGNLSVAYSFQVGVYTKIGRSVFVQCVVQTSSFTHTTASGNLTVGGLPFTSANVAAQNAYGGGVWQGITKANYTQVASAVASNATTMIFQASGSGQAISTVVVADVPTGGSVALNGNLHYVV